MIVDYTNLDLVDDNYLIVWVPCDCKDPECDCFNGAQIAGEVDLTILLRNLAIAGALCEARQPCSSAWYPGCGKPWSRRP